MRSGSTVHENEIVRQIRSRGVCIVRSESAKGADLSWLANDASQFRERRYSSGNISPSYPWRPPLIYIRGICIS